MNYRILTQNELEIILQKLLSKKNSQKYPNVFKLVKEYYKDIASYAVMRFDSEYNDETYDNRLQSISVYDVNDNLVSIKRNKYEEFINKIDKYSFGESESDEPVEDVVICFDETLPVLYVKE